MGKPIIYNDYELSMIELYDIDKRTHSVNRGFEDRITKHDLLTIILRQKRKCFYCNNWLPRKHYQVDHFYPRASGGKNIITNLVVTCRWCNTMKNALDGHAFIHRCKLIIENNHLNKINNDH